MRYALKLAYDGSRFYGSQIQPDVPTVAGALQAALLKGGVVSKGATLSFASRTDRGASALCNVACYDGKRPILGRLNHLLPEQICAWGWAAVPPEFNPRHPVSKTYLYFLPDRGEDFELLKRAAACYCGERDFANFSRREAGVSRKTRIAVTEAAVRRDAGNFIFKFTAPRFLWMQVRKMVGAARAVALGRINLSLLENLLEGTSRAGVDTAPAEGLLLQSIDYGGVEFSDSPKNLQARFAIPAFAAAQRAGVLSKLL